MLPVGNRTYVWERVYAWLLLQCRWLSHEFSVTMHDCIRIIIITSDFEPGLITITLGAQINGYTVHQIHEVPFALKQKDENKSRCVHNRFNVIHVVFGKYFEIG